MHLLLRLQGTMRPRLIATGSLSYPGTANTLTLPSDRGLIHIDFEAPSSAAHAARVETSPLTPAQWLALIARLGEIPNPTVAGKPSSAAIPDPGSSGASAPGEGAPANTTTPGAGAGGEPTTSAPSADGAPFGNAAESAGGASTGNTRGG